MTKVQFDGTIVEAYGKTLPTALDYKGEFDSLDSVEEAREAGEWPSNKEILKTVNDARKASANAAARKSALDAAGIVKPGLDDPDEAFKNIVKTLIAQGKSKETAEQLARTMLS